ncbi:unnamed protein product [Allacma fusca]|nr:unnamed protein product [Allacma fusca]
MPILTFKKSKELQAMNPNKRKLVEEILNWRLDLALRIDEKPEYLIKDQDLLELVSLEDKSPALMTILERISQYSESIELWKASLCKILSQGLKYLENMKATSCHNYGGNGHCAWGCLEDYSEENQKRYYRDNPQSKTAVNRRRRQQKQENKRIRNEQNSREGAPNE